MTDPTFADVASKTVDHIADGVKAISAAAQKVAPHAWEVAVRQQRLESLAGFCVSCLVTILAVVALGYVGRRYRGWVAAAKLADHARDRRLYPSITPKEPTGAEDAAHVHGLCGLVAAVALFAIVVSITSATEDAIRYCNPEYYAAEALLKAVK